MAFFYLLRGSYHFYYDEFHKVEFAFVCEAQTFGEDQLSTNGHFTRQLRLNLATA